MKMFLKILKIKLYSCGLKIHQPEFKSKKRSNLPKLSRKITKLEKHMSCCSGSQDLKELIWLSDYTKEKQKRTIQIQ
jgi:hypothetical protein